MEHARNYKDLTGQKYNRVTFLEYAGVAENGNSIWKVKCDCGTIFLAYATNVLRGTTKSCGCYKAEVLRERNKNRRKH